MTESIFSLGKVVDDSEEEKEVVKPSTIFDLGIKEEAPTTTNIFDLGKVDAVIDDPAELADLDDYTVVMNQLEMMDGPTNKDTILDNPTLVRSIRNIMKSRFSEDTRNDYTFDYRYDKQLNDEEVFEEWQNWMRSLAAGQTVTTGNDAAWFAMADDEQRLSMGASFELFDSMPSIWSDDTTWAEMGDGVRDYIRAGVWDPTTILGLGVGRIWSGVASKGGGFALRTAAKEAAKAAAKKGLNKEAVREVKRKVISEGFKNAGRSKLKAAAVGTSVDMTAAIGADHLYQKMRIGSNVQDRYSLPQSVAAALGVIVVPSVMAATKGITSLAGKAGFEKYVNVYDLHGNKTPEEIEKVVIDNIDLDKVSNKLREGFRKFNESKDLEEFLVPYMQAREEAAELVSKKDIAGNPTLLEDFFETTIMYGKDGLALSMSEAGFEYVPREKNDRVSKFFTDALKYLPDDIVKGYKEAFKKQFGELPEAIEKINTSEELGAWFLNRGRFAGKTLYNRKVLSDLLSKKAEDITAEDMLNAGLFSKTEDVIPASPADRVKYVQSIWKRLVTSHPSTVGLNVKGWAYTTAMNNISDAVLAPLLALKGDFKGAKGSMLGAARRGINVLSYDSTIEAAENLIKIKPEIAEKLFAERAGGVDTIKILERLNLDPNAKVNKLSEKAIDALQTAVGVKLQDEVTKVISFQSALDQNIMKVYGMTFNEFMTQEGAYTKMFSQEFLEKVQEPAIERANRETYSTSWSNRKSNGVFLSVAKQVERFSNSAGGGFLLPFGRFFNTATATFGDYTGFNAFKHIVGHGFKGDFGKMTDDESLELIAKGLVGVGLIYAPRLDGTSNIEEAKQKIKNGLPWNRTQLSDGSLRDDTYEFPGGYVELLSQMFAHIELDGSVPPALKEEAFKVLVSQTFRDSGEVYETLKGWYQVALDADTNKTLNKSIEVLGGGLSRIASGSTRFLEPINQVSMFINEDFDQMDRRQGYKVLNDSLRYVDKIFGFGKDAPKREIATRGEGNEFVDIGRSIGGVRSAAPLTPSERLFGSIGEQSWSVVRWDGTPEYKNRMDSLVSDILNYYSAEAIEKYDFFNKPLETSPKTGKGRIEIAEEVKKKARERTRQVFLSSIKTDDTILQIENKVMSKRKAHIKEALKIIDYDGDVEDIKNEEGGLEKLRYILYLIENREDIMFRDLR